jgi:hypothetical protein
MMTMHSRSTGAQPEITSYVADLFAPYERTSTNFRQVSKKNQPRMAHLEEGGER